MPMSEPVPHNPYKKPEPPWAEERRFGLVVPIGLTILGGVGWLAFGWRTTSLVLWAVAAGLSLMRLTCAPALWPFNKVWMAVAHVLGYVNTRILLGVVFYVVVTPIGWLRRLVGGDPLQRRLDRDADTYWHDRPADSPDPKRWRRQF